jgi:DNA-binding NtrC family response regulator
MDLRVSLPPSSGRTRPRVLYVDDAHDAREAFAAVFGADFEVACVAGGREALEAMAARDVDVLVADMRMSPMRGSDLLARALVSFPDTQRILLTGVADHDDLAEAVNRGRVFAYVKKPWDPEQLRLVLRHASALRALEAENKRLGSELRSSSLRLRDDVEAVARAAPRGRLMATSPGMQRVMAQVGAVATTDASVLLHGETGTGKELIAAEIHERSGRRRARFVAQNLAALPPELMTSELFGHVKGAFTGAQQARRGLFELADGGTLFLDEIGEAPQSLQALLLRALESREFWPVGASEPKSVNVRVVAATNRDLLGDAHAGLFRLDLYYRLAVCPIEVPPLRARPEDVRGIGLPLLESAARRMNREMPRLGEPAWRALEAHPWPGNVRELGNVMERLVIYHAGRDVEPDDLALPQGLRASLYPHLVPFTPGTPGTAATGGSGPPSASYGHAHGQANASAAAQAAHGNGHGSGAFAAATLVHGNGNGNGYGSGAFAAASPYVASSYPPAAPDSQRPRSHAAVPLTPDSAWDVRTSDARLPLDGDLDGVPSPPMSRPRLESVDAIPPGTLVLDLPEGGTTFDDLEREILVQVLARADNNQSRAARSLGMSESTLRSRLKRLGLKG